MNRKRFLTVGAAATAVVVSGKETRARSAANTVRFGVIGCGGMGRTDMNWALNEPDTAIVAVADVDETHARQAADEVEKRGGKRPEIHQDYRKLLERKDVDAVIVGTPDHWHALNLIHAVEAGKDAYCEKPISHNIHEARQMDAATRRHGRVVQVGTWQRSTREFTNAIAYVRAGKLGRVTTVRAWKTDPFRMGSHQSKGDAPAGFDYDAWLGPAAAVPYVPEYTHSNWRWFLNFGSGMTGDWGVHMMDIALLGMSRDTELVMPTEVSAVGGKLAWPDDDRTAPDTHLALFRFTDPDFVLHWETGRKPLDLNVDHGTQFIGADGKTLTVWRGGWRVQGPDGEDLPLEDAPAVPNSHMADFLACVRDRKSPRSDLSSMARTTIVCHLANAALQAGASVRWDHAKFDVAGKVGKNTLAYRREYRKPYRLPTYA